MIKAYRYKLVPNKKQRQALLRTLDICRELYNMGLEQRRGQRIGVYEQKRQLRPQWGRQHIGQDVPIRREDRRCNSMSSLRIPKFGSINLPSLLSSSSYFKMMQNGEMAYG